MVKSNISENKSKRSRAFLALSTMAMAAVIVCFAIAFATDIDLPPGTSDDDAVPDFVIDVYGEGLLKTNLAIPSFFPGAGVTDGGGLGFEGAKILSQDLQFSSFFDIVTAPKLPFMPAGGYTEGSIDFQAYRNVRAELLIAGTYSLDAEGTYTFDLRLFDVIQMVMLTHKTYEGNKSMFRRFMHQFADEVLRSETGTPGPFDSRILFVSDATGRKELYICDYDGENLKRVTHNKTTNLSPGWSPDASKIVYTSYVLRNPDLFILPVKGGRPRRLYGGRGLNYCADWCAANDRIAFASSNNDKENQEIYTIKPDGSDLVQVTHDPWSIDVSPTWSPDGKYIAFVSSRYGDKPQVLAVPSNGGTVARISRTGGYNTDPTWTDSPTGQYIAYCGRAGGGLDILAVRLDGNSLRVLETIAVVNRPGADEAPSFSPDGRFVVYSHGVGSDYDLYMTSMREQKPRRVTNMPGKESSPAWSPRSR